MSRDRALLAAFFLSGAAALGYELLWTRLLSLALGNELLGVYGVLAGFFGGMALGAAALHRRAHRTDEPLRLFVRLELLAAGYALLSPYILYGLADVVPQMLGSVAGDNDSAGALVAATLIAGAAILPGTFAMGATLPALVEARRRVIVNEPDGAGVGRLYAANTAGATVGVLLTVHAILPTAGLAVGAAVLSSIGLASVLVASRWGRQHAKTLAEKTRAEDDESIERDDETDDAPAADPDQPQVDASGDPDPDVANEPWLLLVLMAGTGLIGVGLEVVGIQVLSQQLENTVYTFANIVAVYLLGTAIGSALYTRYAARAVAGRPATVTAGLLVVLSLASTLAAVVMASTPDIITSFAPEGAPYGSHLLAEMAVAAAVFGPPTLVMGATFTHVAGLIAPRGLGRAYALNTLGSALAPLVFGLWVVPDNGYRDAVFVVVYAYLVLFGIFTWFRRFKTTWQLVPIGLVVLATFGAPKSLVLVGTDEGWKVLEQRETSMGVVIVSEKETAEGSTQSQPLRRLQVGRHFRMGGALAFGERRMGHIPLLLHTDAKRALFLGVGTGATLGAVTHAEQLEQVDAVELVPAVVDMLEYFDDINGEVRNDERVIIHAADARRFVTAATEPYDVVVADLFHPGRDGAGGLYALEHFETVRDRLADGGLFAQWLPLYQLDHENFDLIVRTFLAAFDEVHCFLGVYNVQTPALVLVGRTGSTALRIDVTALVTQLDKPVYGQVLMQDGRDLLGAYMMDGAGLKELVGEGPLNTDLRPRVLMRAPRAAYEDDPERGWKNLQRVLDARTGPPDGLLVADDPQQLEVFAGDVQRFGVALERYLHGEATRIRQARLTDDPRTIPASSVDAYLQAYLEAPEFAPSRGMLYTAIANSRDAAEAALPAMLERTPDEPRVYQAYLQHLQRTGNKNEFERIRAEAERRFGR